MTVRTLLCSMPLACALTFAAAPALAGQTNDDATAVVRWNRTLLQAVRDARMPPPQVARALAVVHTSIFDAWAAYDARAVGTRLGDRLRRPQWERTTSNKIEAICFAAHRALVDVFPSRRDDLFDPLLIELGYMPGKKTWGPSDPAGVGLAAADAVIAFRHRDGSNQLGDLTPGGTPYADYTGYVPANDPFTLADPSRWQPLQLPDGSAQRFLVPHWRHVTPFALASASQFRPGGPARYGSAAYVAQSLPIVFMSATLSDRTKAIATYWADGPSTETPPGHWMLFAQAVSARDRHSLDDDVKMFFALANALLDASIAAWDAKVAYDSVRPISAIRFLFAGQLIPSWAGPTRGIELVDGSAWQPYIPTPAFAEYVSGHSTFSAAAATILKRATGSDSMQMRITVGAGSSPIEPGFAPSEDVTLTWNTFSEAADQAGLSRRLGGIHFRDGDMDGRHLGRQVGERAWKKAVTYVLGTARP